MANLIYNQPQTAITWLASGGTNVLTLTSLAAGAGRQGASHDFGATTPRAALYEWRFWCKFATTPVVSQALRIHIRTGDGTRIDGSQAGGDAAVGTEEMLKNYHLLGVCVVDQASTTPTFTASGLCVIRARIVAPVIWNATEDALSSTAGDHGFSLTPVPDEVQDAA